MALNATRLGDAIATAIAAVPRPSPADAGIEFIKPYWRAVAAQIIAELTANGVITADSFTNGAGPVTGTGKIT